jgi:hypothetical protein
VRGGGSSTIKIDGKDIKLIVQMPDRFGIVNPERVNYEKNPFGFFEFRKVHQNLEVVKNCEVILRM